MSLHDIFEVLDHLERHWRTSERLDHSCRFSVNAVNTRNGMTLSNFWPDHWCPVQPRSAATRNHDLAGIRALATFMKKQDTWQDDPTVDIPFAKESRKDPTFLMRGELGQLFEAAANDEDTTRRARNLAIVALLSHGCSRLAAG